MPFAVNLQRLFESKVLTRKFGAENCSPKDGSEPTQWAGSLFSPLLNLACARLSCGGGKSRSEKHRSEDRPLQNQKKRPASEGGPYKEHDKNKNYSTRWT